MTHHHHVLLAAIALVSASCTGASNAQCVVGADCASGACDVSGRCVVVTGADAGATDGGGGSGGETGSPEPGIDGGATPDGAAPPAEGGPSNCVPNGDGTITRDEVPMQAGLRATYLVADNVTWDTTGSMGDAGVREWDLTGALSGDHSAIFEAQAPAGAWWAATFPAATFAMKLADSQSLLGVFQATGTALLLTGVVSPTNASPQTEVTYGTSVPTLQFPLTVGATWTVTSNVTGTVSGVPANYTEQYVSKVDAAGTMKTPFAAFSVLRVGTVLTQTIGLVATVTRSYVFLAECVGPVAAVTSKANETNTEFTSDAEVRRLSP